MITLIEYEIDLSVVVLEAPAQLASLRMVVEDLAQNDLSQQGKRSRKERSERPNHIQDHHWQIVEGYICFSWPELRMRFFAACNWMLSATDFDSSGVIGQSSHTLNKKRQHMQAAIQRIWHKTLSGYEDSLMGVGRRLPAYNRQPVRQQDFTSHEQAMVALVRLIKSEYRPDDSSAEWHMLELDNESEFVPSQMQGRLTLPKEGRPHGLNKWDEPQCVPVSNPPSKLYALTPEQQFDAIRHWFLMNFEDPVHSTPFDEEERGYNYVWGGPYETRDIISDVFGDGELHPDTVEKIIDHLEEISYEWVPSEDRILPPDDEDDEPVYSDLESAHDDMLSAATEAKTAFQDVQQQVANIGHNRPPEPINDLLPDDVHLNDVGDAIDTLQRQDARPEDGGEEAEQALGLLTRVRGWWATKLERTADSFFDQLGTRAADTLFVAISALILKATGWLELLRSLLGI